MKTSLYRHFDAEGNLLYIGISLSALNRLSQHADNSHWFEKISNVTIQHFPNRSAALVAEALAIAKENPAFNINNKRWFPPPPEKKERRVDSENSIIKGIVNFRPMYTFQEVGKILSMNSTTVLKEVENKRLGCIKIPAKSGKPAKGTHFKDKYFVTGWQLIDYIEMLEEESKDA